MLDLSPFTRFDPGMRFLLAVAITTIAMTAGCVQAPARTVDPNCRCAVPAQNQNGGGAYYPYSGR